ncbi:MAG: glycosyltransferase [Micrococcaceae bacterium]
MSDGEFRSALAEATITDRSQGALLEGSIEYYLANLLQRSAHDPGYSRGIANRPLQARIGIISDLFLYKSFEGLADFVPITPTNYRDVGSLDLLLVVSTWRGIDNESWRGVAQANGELRFHLLDTVIPHFRTADVPVVFYSKEDPPNYSKFLQFAQAADVVFTSAKESLPKYERDCPQATHIEVLPFGVSPLHHSPIGSRQERASTVIPFAGSWFTKKYRERSRWGRDLLDAVVAADGYQLMIFDRNSEAGLDRYRFPERLNQHVLPAIDHGQLLNIQRVSDIAINLNSVHSSMTMYANRAIELQAQSTFVLSNYNAGLNSRYPHVHLVNSYRDVLATLESMNEDWLRKAQADGVRSVFSNDLALMRIRRILKSVGLGEDRMTPTVGVVVAQGDDVLAEDMARQTYPEISRTVDANDSSAVATLRAESDVIVNVSSEYRYATTHIEDLVNAFRYTDARHVSKVCATHQEANGRAHRYSAELGETPLSAEFVGNVALDAQVQTAYIVDNIGVDRRSDIATRRSGSRPESMRPILSVVVPIYNNGRHLYHKCFSSLRRSSVFEQMEIILVDDGSDDAVTLETIERIRQEAPHVITYQFPQGGSGSASRPRNKGLELATAEFVTYLDPDNEAINDGYARLLNTMYTKDVDFALGNMTRWRSGHTLTNYVGIMTKRVESADGVVTTGSRSLADLGFTPMSIQATVSRTSWLRGLGLEQPVGAVGQDSFFFQQMFYYAHRVGLLNDAIHTYYGEVESSVVNTVGVKFFQKYLPLESARAAWLTEVGLLDDYKQSRLEPFFTGWYLKKLESVAPKDRLEAESIVARLGRMYGEHEWTSEEALEFWARHHPDWNSTDDSVGDSR